MPKGDDATTYRAPIGTHDVVAPESRRWIQVVGTFAQRAERFGYGLAVTPMFEHVEVFQRVGTGTDVVRKEMYELTDRGDRRLALRPEGTASIVRAYVQHRPTPPWKAWYVAPNFRYERPQRGRYRQHWQLGVEVLGIDDPDVDVEVIALACGFFADLGLRSVRLKLNSMGTPQDRVGYVAELRDHLLRHGAELGEPFLTRAREHPLRLLDAKDPDWQDVLSRAPQLTEHLSDASQAHFERVQETLTALGIPFELAPRLVRGFDYYTSTTFEFASDALDAAQDAIGGGGRYDQLAEEMGGPPTAGIGFGIGIERLLIAAESEGVWKDDDQPLLDAFLIDALGDGSVAIVVADLREAGLAADRAYGDRSVKTQWKLADRARAAYGVMLAAEEAGRGCVVVKDLGTGTQVEVRRQELAPWLLARREERTA